MSLYNNILNLEELIYNNNKPNQIKEDYFNKVLLRCHNLIKRFNTKEKIKSCKFEVPLYEFGVPVYNFKELLHFLYESLVKNGLYVKILNNGRQLYISWDEKDVNINAYSEIKKKQQEYLFVEAAIKPSSIITSKRSKKEIDNALLIQQAGVVVNKDKYLQAKKIQDQREQYYKQICSNEDNEYTNFNNRFKL
jgi:hypothetical protein